MLPLITVFALSHTMALICISAQTYKGTLVFAMFLGASKAFDETKLIQKTNSSQN